MSSSLIFFFLKKSSLFFIVRFNGNLWSKDITLLYILLTQVRFGQDSLWKIGVIVEKLSPTSLLSMSVRNQSSIDFADLGEIWSRLFVENKGYRRKIESDLIIKHVSKKSNLQQILLTQVRFGQDFLWKIKGLEHSLMEQLNFYYW